MNIHLISDTHFNHEKLSQWGGRTGDWQKDLWEGLRNIERGDTLIHLGDICIGDDAAIHSNIERLVCKKILVRGNHDKKSAQWYYEHGWDFVCDGFHLIYQGHYLYFSHRPTQQMGAFTHNIHGHTHGNLHRSEEYVDFYAPGYHIDISPELMGYKPIRLDTLMEKAKKGHLKYPTA